jgi:Family of unknown function (DUF6502)
VRAEFARMPKARTKRSTAAVGVFEARYGRECLERLAHILGQTGHLADWISGEMQEICARLPKPVSAADPRRRAHVADLSHVIARWHKTAEYLDARGKPRALALRARGPCLRALIARVLPDANPSVVVRWLMRLKAIRQVGTRYVPTSRYVLWNEDLPAGRWHELTTLLGLLRTVDHNLSGTGPALLERSAINPNYPVSKLASIHRYLKVQAGEVLGACDDRMARDELKVQGGERRRLGVAFFAFEEPVLENASDPTKTEHSPARPPAVAKKRRKERA